MRNKQEKSPGFTLIELLVTISIAAILLGIAIPSFTSTIASNRLTTNANELVTALNLARSEAIKRGIQVTVLNLGAATQWEGGWNVFVDINGNEAFNDNGNATLCEAGEDCLLRIYGALPGGYTLRTSSGTTYQNFAAYLPSGLSTMPIGDTFTLCSELGAAVPRRRIFISTTGRPGVDAAPGACP